MGESELDDSNRFDENEIMAKTIFPPRIMPAVLFKYSKGIGKKGSGRWGLP